jgi:hypothetical protein
LNAVASNTDFIAGIPEFMKILPGSINLNIAGIPEFMKILPSSINLNITGIPEFMKILHQPTHFL